MADRVTQVVAEVLRSTALAPPVSASTTITLTGAGSALKNAVSAGATTITFAYTASNNKSAIASGATTLTFSYVAAQNSARMVGSSTLVLLSYTAAENSSVNVSGSTTITFFASCSGDKATTASASTTIALGGSASEVSAFQVSGATTVTLSEFGYRDMDYAVTGSTTITLASTISSTRDIVTSASTLFMFSPLGFGDGNHGVAFDFVSLAGEATSIKVVSATGSTTVTMSPIGHGVRDVPSSAESLITASWSSPSARDVPASATTQLRFRDLAAPLNHALGGNPMAANRVGYLGRFQQGQVLTLVLRTLGYQGRIILPDTYPSAAVWSDSGELTEFDLPAIDRANSIFALPIFLDREFALGRYRVVYRYVFGAYVGTAVDYFEVIAGGDPGGALISLCSYDRPEASYVLAQLSAGKLVQGRNPKI